MKIKRTYKPKSLKAGAVEFIDEAKLLEIAGQTDIAFHKENECKPEGYEGSPCFYCGIPALRRLTAGAMVETFFSVFELVEG